jgi:hypothetical protein
MIGVPTVASAGEGPAIHVFRMPRATKIVDARHKAGHDDNKWPKV